MSIEEAIKNLNIMLDSAQRRTRRNIVIPDLIEAIEMAIEALKEQRPHGEWIETGRTNIYGGFEIECSVCHTTLMVSPNRWKIGENFCDVCGADMRKKEGEKE